MKRSESTRFPPLDKMVSTTEIMEKKWGQERWRGKDKERKIEKGRRRGGRDKGGKRLST